MLGEETTLERGTITGISGHPMSGLWTLELEKTIDGDFPTKHFVHIESGMGVRSLARAFGATEGSGDLLEKITGQEIFYSVNSLGVLEAFTPVGEAPPEFFDFERDDS